MILESLYETTRQLLSLSKADLQFVLTEMTEEDKRTAFLALKYDWHLWRRAKQVLPTGDWKWCLLSAGRRFGKTRAAMEILREAAESGEHEHVAIVSPTFLTLHRDLINGPSGILAVSPPWFAPTVFKAGGELRWPKHPVTGVILRAVLLSGDKADRIRGSEFSLAICDELPTWAEGAESFMNLDFALTRGVSPRGIIMMTPKRKGPGSAFSRDLLYGRRGPDGVRHQRDDMIVIHGATEENIDLDPAVFQNLFTRFSKTADAVTELEGGLPQEAEGAMWTLDGIEEFRLKYLPPGVVIDRLITSVDPSRSRVGTGDMCGIITMAKGSDGHVYIFSDDSLRGTPDEWIERAVSTVERQRSDSAIYEQNRLGADLVTLIRERARPYKQSWVPVTARGTKRERAEPVAALYKAGRVHHVGDFPLLEEEMTSWDQFDASPSPDRLDALVHGVRELLLSEKATRQPLVII